jgi:hypothetical protein
MVIYEQTYIHKYSFITFKKSNHLSGKRRKDMEKEGKTWKKKERQGKRRKDMENEGNTRKKKGKHGK